MEKKFILTDKFIKLASGKKIVSNQMRKII